MLNLSKMKKIFSTACLILAFSATQAVADDDDMCLFLSPICLFKTILKSAPTIPVHDFISTPAMIRHVPAALAKEEQVQLKQEADIELRKVRSKAMLNGSDPSDLAASEEARKIPFVSPNFDGGTPAAREEYMSLEPFPISGSDAFSVPLEIAKAIEVIFLRPGWKDENSKLTNYDKNLMKYMRGHFFMDNTVEIMGFSAYMQNKVDDMLNSAKLIQEQIRNADDLNKSQRANYAAQLMEYELMIIQNQIRAATMQEDIADRLNKVVLDAPIFGNM